MTYLENSKQYTGSDLENIFFRPMLTGESAQDLGVRVLYNMPQPTHVQLWDGQRNILQKFTSAGWAGGKAATKYEKTVNLNRVKAELGFSAANYFSMVYEKVSSLVNTHMDDLSGTELEQAETALFKQALAENIRVTMWIGDTSAASGYNTFDGLMNRINWKSSARMGDLMVNQFDATTSVEVTVLLDIEDANILREEAQVEESIRITSSLAARMVKNKMNLWVKSNAKDEETGEELRVHLAAGAGKTAELNRKLACVQLGGNLTGSAEFLHKEAEKELTGHTYVVVSKNRTDEVREALHLLSGAQNQVLWVIPYLPGEEVPSEQNRAYTAIGWEVKPWK